MAVNKTKFSTDLSSFRGKRENENYLNELLPLNLTMSDIPFTHTITSGCSCISSPVTKRTNHRTFVRLEASNRCFLAFDCGPTTCSRSESRHLRIIRLDAKAKRRFGARVDLTMSGLLPTNLSGVEGGYLQKLLNA